MFLGAGRACRPRSPPAPRLGDRAEAPWSCLFARPNLVARLRPVCLTTTVCPSVCPSASEFAFTKKRPSGSRGGTWAWGARAVQARGRGPVCAGRTSVFRRAARAAAVRGFTPREPASAANRGRFPGERRSDSDQQPLGVIQGDWDSEWEPGQGWGPEEMSRPGCGGGSACPVWTVSPSSVTTARRVHTGKTSGRCLGPGLLHRATPGVSAPPLTSDTKGARRRLLSTVFKLAAERGPCGEPGGRWAQAPGPCLRSKATCP